MCVAAIILVSAAFDPNCPIHGGRTMLKLYYAPGACSFVPHVALEIIKSATGEDFEAHIVKLHKGEQNAPEFLALNVNGQVPVLVVDGKPLTQVIAICDYLNRRYPTLGLLPSDPAVQAEMLSLFAWMNNTVHPTFTHVFLPHKFSDNPTTQADLKRYNLIQYRKLLERLGQLVAKAKPYLFGEKLSVLDIYAVVFLRWGELAGMNPADFPEYKAFVDRVGALPPVAAALERERLPLHSYKG
jgi:glutathione S-transferase